MVISIQCPSCSTAFPVDTSKVPEDGVYARCSVCAGVFLVERPREAVAEVPVASYAPLPRPAPPEPWVAPSQEEWREAPPEPLDVAEAAVPEVAPEEQSFYQEEHLRAADEDFVGADILPPLDEPFAIDTPRFDAEPSQQAAPASAPYAPSASPPDAPPASAPAFTFGRRDPHEKARRLARVLVSDMIMYNPERHTRAIASGSLREDFDEEIRKSWQEYVEQVGEEIARGTSYFDDALNEILAQGQRLFP